MLLTLPRATAVLPTGQDLELLHCPAAHSTLRSGEDPRGVPGESVAQASLQPLPVPCPPLGPCPAAQAPSSFTSSLEPPVSSCRTWHGGGLTYVGQQQLCLMNIHVLPGTRGIGVGFPRRSRRVHPYQNVTAVWVGPRLRQEGQGQPAHPRADLRLRTRLRELGLLQWGPEVSLDRGRALSVPGPLSDTGVLLGPTRPWRTSLRGTEHWCGPRRAGEREQVGQGSAGSGRQPSASCASGGWARAGRSQGLGEDGRTPASSL